MKRVSLRSLFWSLGVMAALALVSCVVSEDEPAGSGEDLAVAEDELTVSDEVPSADISAEVEMSFLRPRGQLGPFGRPPFGDPPFGDPFDIGFLCASWCESVHNQCLGNASSGSQVCTCNNTHSSCIAGCGLLPPQPIQPCPTH